MKVKTNVGFLVILLSVLFLAVLEGDGIRKTIVGEEGNSILMVGEIQQIAFIILTLVILVVATLHPKRIYLAAYSAMTLGFIIILSGFHGITFLDIDKLTYVLEVI
ncbi:hypothetical protein K8R47_01585, partial [archaeon]|nr:hypothetical protein [archaeon]